MQQSLLGLDEWAVLNNKKYLVIAACLSSVVETLTHPPVVFGFRPCGLLKEP